MLYPGCVHSIYVALRRYSICCVHRHVISRTVVRTVDFHGVLLTLACSFAAIGQGVAQQNIRSTNNYHYGVVGR